MTKRSKSLAFVVCALVVAITATTALAGHQTSGVKSYTGCLVSGDGVMIKIKEGESPRSACTGGQVQAHFSGGDITKISVGSGLSLPNGGDNGEVRIVLDASHSLPQNCTAGRVAEWNGTAWVCGVDNDTTYSEGTGLDLSAGNEFSIEPAYRVKNTPDCSSGQFATGFDGDGDIQCAAPAATSVSAVSAAQGAEIGLPDDGAYRTVVELNLAAGTWVLIGKGAISADGDASANSFVRCSLRQGSTVIDVSSIDHPDDGLNHGHGVALTAIVQTAGEKIDAACLAAGGADGVGARTFRIVALKIA